ncbi:MAG: hypothetical protein AMXMBFR84_16480 [Candidatus Hydrogenedentota bacterium]
MAIDVVIVSYNTADLLRRCLQSIAHTASDRTDWAVYVVDNASSDGSVDMITREFPGMTVIPLESNIGFGPANNAGAKAGKNPLILFLNSDAELTPGVLNAMERMLLDDESAIAVGPKLVYPEGSFQPSCRRFPNPLRNFWQLAGLHTKFPSLFPRAHTWLSQAEHEAAHEVDMVSGACFLIRRTYFESVGGFDDRVFLYEEELDLFYPTRRRGLSVLYCPAATVIHHHGASSGEKQGSELAQYHLFFSKYLVFEKHYGPWSATITYWTDQILYGLSALLNRLRGKQTPATQLRAKSQKAYRASKIMQKRQS